MRHVFGSIDPAKYAGEGWYATDEYARPADLPKGSNVRAETGREGDYFPTSGMSDAVYNHKKRKGK